MYVWLRWGCFDWLRTWDGDMILPLSHDSPEWLARMSLNLLPILFLLPPSIGLSACVHFCEVNVHLWYMWEWKLYVLSVCVCVSVCEYHLNKGWGLRCFSLQGVFTPSHLHPTSPFINVFTCESLTWPDPSPSPSPAEHAGCRDPVLWNWVLSNAAYHKTDWNRL